MKAPTKPKLLEALAPKMRLFALEYLVDLNASQAHIRAGYAPKNADVAGPRMLKHPGVRAFLDAALAKREAKLVLSAERVLQELMRVGFLDIQGAYGPDGQLLELSEMPEDVRRAIAGIDSEELTADDGPSGRVLKVKFNDKLRALELMGKHLKLFTELVEARVDAFTDEERAERVALLLDRARARRAGQASGEGDAEL